MDPYVWQPFMGVQYPGQDGFSFSMPIWAAPPLTIGGAITANIILELEIVGEACLPTKRIGAMLVPQATLRISADVFPSSSSSAAASRSRQPADPPH